MASLATLALAPKAAYKLVTLLPFLFTKEFPASSTDKKMYPERKTCTLHRGRKSQFPLTSFCLLSESDITLFCRAFLFHDRNFTVNHTLATEST